MKIIVRQRLAGALATVLSTIVTPLFAQAPPIETPAETGSTAAEEPVPPIRPTGGAPPSDDAFRMGSPPALPEGMTEEEMWPAATADGWSKDVLVRWQRSFEDALTVARAQQRPLLVAVNMDGEIASEHFAGVRYREPETATLLSAYVCVVASVYRHTPRDYDEEGRRVECPRFQTVTCGEHIEAERELYEKYFDGKRISPRHIVLDLEQKETFDVYYSWDTATVFTTFRKGVEGWPQPVDSPEPTLVNLVRSAAVDDREALERAYREGDRALQRTILASLIEEDATDQVEVLRAAIFGLDLELAKLAREALARCATEPALDLMAEALKVPLETSERELLLAAVERLGRTSQRARTLGALHSGLSLHSRHFAAVTREYEANAQRPADVQTLAEAVEARADRSAALVELATALLARAHAEPERRHARLLVEDALSAVRDAQRAGASGPGVDAALALAAAELGDVETARTRAIAAIEGGLLQTDDAVPDAAALPEASRARLLLLFAAARQSAIRDAYRAGTAWPPAWLSDVNAAYTALAAGPLADAAPLVDYHDFLRWIGATPRADSVLDEALERFPDSPVLHDRLRARLLWEGGPVELERDYARRLARQEGASAGATTWFAGYAALVAAEHFRRRGELEQATAAYERGIAHFERNAELFPDARDDSLHFVAMGLAGRARVALERGEFGAATESLILALRTRPSSAATQDGLGITPVMTARMLVAQSTEAGAEQLAARTRAALEALDPSLLEPPPSELPPGRRGGRRPRGERPGGG